MSILLVLAHPDPLDPTPSFDDNVSFLFVVVGVVLATYLHAGTPYDAGAPFTSTVMYSYESIGLATTVARIVFGVAVILAWRFAAKKACYIVLPPIYRLFGLPARKHHLPAKMYKTVDKPIPLAPSVLHLPIEEMMAKTGATTAAIVHTK